jgi:hypothetical protein
MMEPMYNSRGRIVGYRPVEMAPVPAKASEMPKPSTTSSTTVTQAGNTVTKTETKVTQAGYVEPAPEPARRGILSRIFRR